MLDGLAIYYGIKNSNSKWYVTLDGDGENNPIDILKVEIK